MEIKLLLEAFKKALPDYQKAVDENWSLETIIDKKMASGLCLYTYREVGFEIMDVFAFHYVEYLNFKGAFLFPPTEATNSKTMIKKAIKPRLKFLKSEIPYLEGLIKKGYTHI